MQFVGASGRLSEPFYFVDHKPHPSSQTWQVRRSEFDQIMLENAREHGVEVNEGVRVLEVLFEGRGPSACASRMPTAWSGRCRLRSWLTPAGKVR